MDDLFSLDVNFQRIALMTVIGFFIIALLCFVFWSVCFYLPKLERIKEIKKSDELTKEIYLKKGLPMPEYINSEEF